MQEEKDFSLWTVDETRRGQYDVKAKTIIASTLTLDEFYKISIYKTVKEMWQVLDVTHEGTEERVRNNTLIQGYEMLRIMPKESIYDVQK